MTQTATVLKVLPGGMAEIEVTRKGACSADCDSCHGCAHPEEKITVLAENAAKAEVGDSVTVESPTKKVLKAAFLVYVLPLILMFAALFAFRFSERLGAIAALAGFLLGLLICWYVTERSRKRTKFEFIITEILR